MNNRLQQFLELENLTPSQLADTLGVQRSRLSHILSGRNKPGYDFISKLLTKFPTINAEWVITGKGKIYKEVAPPSPNNSNNFGKSNNLNFYNSSNSQEKYQRQNKSSNFSNGNFGNGNFDAILDDEENLDNDFFQNQNFLDRNSSTQNLPKRESCEENSNLENLSNNIFFNQEIEEHQNYSPDENQKNSENDASSIFFGEFIKSNTEDSNNSAHTSNTQNANNKQITPNNITSQLNQNELNKQKCTVIQKKRTIKRVIVFYSDGSFEELFPNR